MKHANSVLVFYLCTIPGNFLLVEGEKYIYDVSVGTLEFPLTIEDLCYMYCIYHKTRNFDELGKLGSNSQTLTFKSKATKVYNTKQK